MKNVECSVEWRSIEHYGWISDSACGTCFEVNRTHYDQKMNETVQKVEIRVNEEGYRAVGAKKIGDIWGI